MIFKRYIEINLLIRLSCVFKKKSNIYEDKLNNLKIYIREKTGDLEERKAWFCFRLIDEISFDLYIE